MRHGDPAFLPDPFTAWPELAEMLLGRAVSPSDDDDVREQPPWPSALIARARRMVEDPAIGASFARAARRYSDDPSITGTHAGASKAELFIGDLLYDGGARAPTHQTRGWDGAAGRRYLPGDQWPARSDLFLRVTDLQDLAAGDILVVLVADSRCAIVELVVDAGAPVLTVGARTRGLVLDARYGRLLAGAARHGEHFATPDARLYLLRPRR